MSEYMTPEQICAWKAEDFHMGQVHSTSLPKGTVGEVIYAIAMDSDEGHCVFIDGESRGQILRFLEMVKPSERPNRLRFYIQATKIGYSDTPHGEFVRNAEGDYEKV